jgi:DNA-binding MarR family transcriptional regulator
MQKAVFQHKLHTLFTEVTALAHQLRKTAAKTHRADDCPPGSLSLLRIIDQHGPQPVPAIARARALSRQNIQVLVNRLRTHGLVTLAANPAHKRSSLVHLTGTGRALLTAASRQEIQSTEALLPYIPETRLLPAATLLSQLRQLLGGPQLLEQPLPRESPAQSPTTFPRKRLRRKRPAPATAETPPPEPSEPEEAEFPVNLL